MTSEKLSRAFYRRLGAEGLAARTQPEWDASIVASLVEMIPAGARVLDVGCGYGRITLPLASYGYRIEGLDVSPELLAAAQRRALVEGLGVKFTLGSMTDLPYEDSSFDAAICLWSAFNELLATNEQLAALSEMLRVLGPEGFAFIDGPLYTEPSEQEIKSGIRRGPAHRVAWDLVEGILNPHYRHDEASLAGLCRALDIDGFETSVQSWGGRNRLILHLRKAATAS